MNLIKKYRSLLVHFLKYALTIPFVLGKWSFRYDKKNTIAVFAQPRGGSTWFTNLLLKIPGTSKIDGPLYQGYFQPDGRMPKGNATKIKAFKNLNFYFHQHIPASEVFSEARRFFHKLFSHRFATPYIYQETSLLGLPFSKRFIFKFYQANLLLPWINRNFNVRPIVLLRNPYAVVASQLKHHAFQEAVQAGKYKIPDFRHSDFFDPYKAILEEIRLPEEILAAMWCINYLPLIREKDHHLKWLTVSYEGLLLHRIDELNRLFTYLEVPHPKNLKRFYRNPSISTDKTSRHFQNASAHLMTWKVELSTAQIKNIERVLDGFGVLGYSQSLEPDYTYLYGNSDLRKKSKK